VGRLGVPSILRRRWLLGLVVVSAAAMAFAALVLLLVSGVNLVWD